MPHILRLSVIGTMLLPWPAGATDKLSGTCAGISGKVLDAGLARGELEKETADPSAPSGVDWRMKNILLVQKTSRIPLANGSIMLVNYDLSGLPIGQPVNIRIVIEFPLMTGADGRRLRQHEGALSLDGKSSSYTGQTYWAFDKKYPLEMVAGLYAFSRFYGDCLLFRKEFEVFKP